MASSTTTPAAGGSAAATASRREPADGRRRAGRWPARAGTAAAIAVGAVALRVGAGVGFANYDTLYALVWGQQAARGETPQYGIPVAPTPHPLVEALGVALAPLGPAAAAQVAVALGFLALAGCGWAVYRLGAEWFNRPAGAVAAALVWTRVPVVSYGVRAYVDVPYLGLILCALLVETRHRRAGAPVLGLLAVAGLMRPEAWVFAAGYWVYVAWPTLRARTVRSSGRPDRDAAAVSGADGGAGRDATGFLETGRSTGDAVRTPRQLAGLAALVAAAPLVWVASDWLVTGHPAWSLTNTRHTAETLHRETGLAKVPEWVPRRIGEVLGPYALAVAALGGVAAVAWLRARAALGVCAGVAAVGVFAAFAAVGLPIDTRYAFLAAAIGCVFAGVAVSGWWELPRGDPRRRWWAGAAAVSVVALAASVPSQYRTDHHQLQELGRQQRIQDELTALVRTGAVTTACEPIGVADHAPVPLLALWLEAPPSAVANLQTQTIAHGTYVDPADAAVLHEYLLDRNDPHHPVAVPAGFTLTRTDRSWRIYERCAAAGGGG